MFFLFHWLRQNYSFQIFIQRHFILIITFTWNVKFTLLNMESVATEFYWFSLLLYDRGWNKNNTFRPNIWDEPRTFYYVWKVRFVRRHFNDVGHCRHSWTTPSSWTPGPPRARAWTRWLNDVFSRPVSSWSPYKHAWHSQWLYLFR